MEAKGVVGASAPKWISVKDMLPEQGEIVLVYVIDYGITTSLMNCFGEWSSFLNETVTHWMPLPEPPGGV